MNIDKLTSSQNIIHFLVDKSRDPKTREKFGLKLDKNDNGETFINWRPIQSPEKSGDKVNFKEVAVFALANKILDSEEFQSAIRQRGKDLLECDRETLRGKFFTKIVAFNFAQAPNSPLRINAAALVKPQETLDKANEIGTHQNQRRQRDRQLQKAVEEFIVIGDFVQATNFSHTLSVQIARDMAFDRVARALVAIGDYSGAFKIAEKIGLEGLDSTKYLAFQSIATANAIDLAKQEKIEEVMPLLRKYYSVDYLSYSIMLTTIFKGLVKQGHFDKVVKIINVIDDKLVISGYESITQIKTKTLNSIFEKLLKRGELDQARLCAHMMPNEADNNLAKTLAPGQSVSLGADMPPMTPQQLLLKAIQLDPNRAQAYYNLGTTLEIAALSKIAAP